MTLATSAKRIALIDDARIFHHSLRRELGRHVEFISFYSPEEFWAAVEQEPKLLSLLSLVITDLRFENSVDDGTTVARRLKLAAPNLPILLGTTGLVSNSAIVGLFTGVVDKTELSWSEVERLCRLS